MPVMDDHDPLTVPEGTRLFYIGPPKTGTTSLQEAARAQRDVLYEHGVYYPGRFRNHRKPVFAMLQEPDWLSDWVGGQPMAPGATYEEAGRIHPMSEWTDLMEDIAASPATRSVVTHEWAASASDDEAQAFAQDLGQGRTHVVITLRPLTDVLPSQWIESVKEGVTADFERWLEALYQPDDDIVPERMRRYLDHAGVVERWARVVGSQNVTVIVVDKADRGLLLRTFEELLGLPERTLTGIVSDRLRTNRSMSLPEAQVIQQVNTEVVRPDEMSWRVYLAVMRFGVITKLLGARTPGEAERRVVLPRWAAERAERAGVECAERIAATGVRVVGDLDRLHGRAATAEDVDGPHDDADAFRSIAVESLIGALDAATVYEKMLARRIDLARERRVEESGRRDEVARLLEKEKVSRRRTQELLDQEKTKRRRAQERLKQQKAKLEAARSTVARLKRRTIRDQVKGLSAQDRQRTAAESFSTHDLAGACAIRLGHKLRTRRSLRLR